MTASASQGYLPVELFRPILGHVSDRKALCSLLVSSKSIHPEAERRLYSKVDIPYEWLTAARTFTKHENLLNRLSDPRIGSFVESLDIWLANEKLIAPMRAALLHMWGLRHLAVGVINYSIPAEFGDIMDIRHTKFRLRSLGVTMRVAPEAIKVFRSPHAEDVEDLMWFPPPPNSATLQQQGNPIGDEFFDPEMDLRRLRMLYVGFFTLQVEPIVGDRVERLRCSFGNGTIPTRAFERVGYLKVDEASGNESAMDVSTAFPNLVYLDAQRLKLVKASLSGLTLIRKIKTSWSEPLVMFPKDEELRKLAESLFAGSVGRSLQFVEIQYLTSDGARWQVFEYDEGKMTEEIPMRSTDWDEWKKWF